MTILNDHSKLLVDRVEQAIIDFESDQISISDLGTIISATESALEQPEAEAVKDRMLEFAEDLEHILYFHNEDSREQRIKTAVARLRDAIHGLRN